MLLGLDQAALAALANVSPATISNTERGHGVRDDTLHTILSAVRGLFHLMETVLDGPNCSCYPTSFSPTAVRRTIANCCFDRCSSRRPVPAIGGAQPTVRWCPANKRAKATKEPIGCMVQAELPISSERRRATLTEEPRGC